MQFHQTRQLVQILRRKPSAAGNGHGFQPEFCQHAILLNLDVMRLTIFIGLKEKTIRADAKYGGHGAANYGRVCVACSPARLTSEPTPRSIAALAFVLRTSKRMALTGPARLS